MKYVGWILCGLMVACGDGGEAPSATGNGGNSGTPTDTSPPSPPPPPPAPPSDYDDSAYFSNPQAGTASPHNLPVVMANHLKYLGGFRLPAGTGNATFDYGGNVIAFNPANSTLFALGHTYGQLVAEVSIPQPRTDFANVASIVQDFRDPTQGNRNRLVEGGLPAVSDVSGFRTGGLLVHGNRLIGTTYGYYGNSSGVGGQPSVLSHFVSSSVALGTGFEANYRAGSTGSPEMVAGFMSHVPAEWRSTLGGSVLTGQGTIAILDRTSYGPAAFAFSPDDFDSDPAHGNRYQAGANAAPAQPLLYYTGAHSTLNPGAQNSQSGPATVPSPIYNQASQLAGMVMVPGSRSILYFGHVGTGSYDYGSATSDPERDGRPVTNSAGQPIGDYYFYDPTKNDSKGPHAYPYLYQVWAYDANEILRVRQAGLSPWDVKPYATWKLPFPFFNSGDPGGGAAFDPARNWLFVAQPNATGPTHSQPIIHVFELDFSVPAPATVPVRGNVFLMQGTLELGNGSDRVTVTSDNRTRLVPFEFPQQVAPGAAFDVRVISQPAGLSCTVYGGAGAARGNSAVETVTVKCARAS